MESCEYGSDCHTCGPVVRNWRSRPICGKCLGHYRDGIDNCTKFLVHAMSGVGSKMYGFTTLAEAVQFASGAVILNKDYATAYIFNRKNEQVGFITNLKD